MRNPVALAEQITDRAPENRILGNVTGTLLLIDGLTAQTTLGADYTSSVRQTYIPRTSPLGAEFNGVARQAERSLQNLNFQQLLTATPKLGDQQELEVVGGYEYSSFTNNGFDGDRCRASSPTRSSSTTSAPARRRDRRRRCSYIQESKLVSFFSRANYGYAGKYYLTGVIRRDGSSRLAEGHKWSTFPAISASWRLNNEDFMKRLPLLHPRAARGLGTSGQPGGAAVRHAAAAQDRQRRQVSVRRRRGDDGSLGRAGRRTPTSSGRPPSRRTSDSTGASGTTASPA